MHVIGQSHDRHGADCTLASWDGREGDSGPYTQAVGLIKSLRSLVNSVWVSTPKCCRTDCQRWKTAPPVRATTVYCMLRIGLRRSGLWLIRQNQTSAFLC